MTTGRINQVGGFCFPLALPAHTNKCAAKKEGKTLRALFPKPLSLLEIHQEKKEEGSRTDNSKRRKKSKRVVPKTKGKIILLFWSFIYGFLVYFLNPFLRILVFMVFTHGTFKYSSCDDDIYIALPLPLIFSRREGSRRNGATNNQHTRRKQKCCATTLENLSSKE